MAFWAYMLRCADGKFYVGHTDNLEHRIGQHQRGEADSFTAKRRPVEFVWCQEFGTRYEALASEQQIKGWSRAKKAALIAGDWERIRALASRSSVLRDAASTGSAAPQDDRISTPPVRPEERLSPGEGASRRTIPTPIPESQRTAPPPAIVLVRPQLAENIGKAARAMLNFGLTDLRLVAPRDGWPNPDAGPAASGADVVIGNARVFDTVADAVADCAHVFATTVRKRGVVKPVVDAEQAAGAIHAEPGGSAVLFGPERAGLETEDVALARTILTVPINPEFGSLNLAQAVILVAYEWSKRQRLAQPPKAALDPPAPHAELEGLVQQLDGALDDAGFYYPPSKAPTTKRAVRSILTKPGWSAQEVRTMRGVIAALVNPRPKA